MQTLIIAAALVATLVACAAEPAACDGTSACQLAGKQDGTQAAGASTSLTLLEHSLTLHARNETKIVRLRHADRITFYYPASNSVAIDVTTASRGEAGDVEHAITTVAELGHTKVTVEFHTDGVPVRDITSTVEVTNRNFIDAVNVAFKAEGPGLTATLDGEPVPVR